MRKATLASALACLFLGVLACEPRIDEPVPPARSAGKPAERKRCIRETPAVPARALPRGNAPDPTCPADPDKPAPLREGRVVFTDAGKKAIAVEVTASEHDRERGLMYRRSMPDDHGMIFGFEERRDHTFWMHNTCIPLDMLFIDKDGTIVGIEENVPTMDDSTFAVGCPSTYVLEVNAGFCRKNGVAAGQRVDLEGI